MKKDNIIIVLSKFFRLFNLSLSRETIYEELLKHPDYPSLLAISDVLSNFKINNAAFRVSDDELTNVPWPFIAHTNINNGDFVIVNKINNEGVTISNEKWNRHRLPLAEFKKLFKGIVLVSETPVPQINKLQLPPLVNLRIPVTIAGTMLILISALLFHTNYFTSISWLSLLLTTFKCGGLATSVLLLIQSIDSNNPLVQKLCQSVSDNNCNKILSSKAAKVFEGLTWSEVGFFYFTGTLLLLIFGGGSPAIWQILLLLNLISLPYTFYSIYYQALVAKQWCVMCCTVQALLWLEFVPLIIHYVNTAPMNFTQNNSLNTHEWANTLSSAFICLLLPVIIWMLLKPLLLQIQQLYPLKQQLQKFKFNSELFTTTLMNQPKYAQPDEEWSIVLGNVEANNIITMVTNPYCQPCAATHKQLHELLKQNGDLQARIVFTSDNTENDLQTPVSRHLMTLHGMADKTMVTNALYDWYEQKQKDYKEWAKTYPVQLNKTEYNKINNQKAWCKMAEVTATPMMLLNGYRLPDLYRLEDIKYML